MLLLSARFDGTRTLPVLPAAAVVQVAVATLGLVSAGVALEGAGGVLAIAGGALAGGAVHAGFLALGWVVAQGGRPGWHRPALRLGAVLIGASLLGRAGPWGSLAYLAVPVAVLLEARGRRELAAIGFAWARWRAALAGLGIGGFLGIHLLVAASLTLGYPVRLGPPGLYLAAVAYDVGVNALTAEWLFRGALFSWWWRRWALLPAAGASTGLAITRYLLDAHLPGAVEVWLGTGFYMGVLGAGACALRAWSGSLLPGYLATATFFLAYRALGH